MIFKPKSVLFLQCTNAGAYPPIMNAAHLMADEGWQVTVLSYPSLDTAKLTMSHHPRIKHRILPIRRDTPVRPHHYAAYVSASAVLAVAKRPNYIYASDTLAALPALVAAHLSGARIIYHEHDSPMPGALRPLLARWRSRAANVAKAVILPNAERARLVTEELGLDPKNIHVVWNVPRKSELPAIKRLEFVYKLPLTLYYHGSITPERVPETVVEAVHRMGGKVRLRVAGYEAPDRPGYLARLVDKSRGSDGVPLLEYVGSVDRQRVLALAAEADVGLALMPMKSDDINMRYMAGASNKAFDYMAAGLTLLVSDLPDWRDMFVASGYAQACVANDVPSIVAALSGFVENHISLRKRRLESRIKIENDWNYDCQFGSLLSQLGAIHRVETLLA